MNRRHAIVGMAVLLLGLLAIGATFVSGMATASRYFDRAAAAQAQLSVVSEIEAASLGDGAKLNALLAEYRRSIDRESALPGTVRGSQLVEAKEAHDLTRLLASSSTNSEARSLIARIAVRERGEAQAVAREMLSLRERMVVLAVTLTAGAALLALIGGWALLAANRKLEGEVAIRTARLVDIDRSRRLFFAKAGHELRTPVTAMRSEAEVALADPAPTLPAFREALDQIVVQAELLDRRVADLLGLARADDGKIALRHEAVDLSAVVAEAALQAAPHARSADIVLQVDALPGSPAVMGDAKWLVQALVAILDNGVKFSPTGATLRLVTEHRDNQTRIAIIDTGPGVLPTELPRVFDAYYQTADGTLRGGSGLGLALARWVVEQHGGTIAAHNDNPGCTILIELPVAS
ncbi:MAG: HAMP domain-containing sensor histidine kinase [Pseudomonadota bacterium]